MGNRNLLKSLVFVTATSFMVTGCGSDSSSNPGGFSGILVDEAVEGVHWSCGSKSGVTNKSGNFGSCPDGSTITFKIGDVVLGTVHDTSDHIMTIQDLVGVPRSSFDDPKVTGVAAVLLSLDDDGNPSNGISITSKAAKAFSDVTGNKQHLDFATLDVGKTIAEVSKKTQNHSLKVVTQNEASAHLVQTNESIKIGRIKSPTQPSDFATN